MKWVAFFSQTGSEILNISKKLNRFPNQIICNNNDIGKINAELTENKPVFITRNKPTIDEYYEHIGKDLSGNDILITLHGWLRILPKEVCESYNNIWNLHPGLITQYPELKGKDPQERVVGKRETYPNIGIVIHKVVPEVDEGPVVLEKKIKNEFDSADQVYYNLHNIATDAWVEFLSEIF
mgnify:CR=1 FL=1